MKLKLREYAKVPEDQWPEMFAAVDRYNQVSGCG